MKTISIANRTVCQLGQGTWNMGDDPSAKSEEIKTLRTGIDLGMRLIDTAEMYGNGRSELLVGEAIENIREDVVLVSKVLPSNASSEGVVKACENSLRRLKTDYLDLYLLHWEGRYPLEETIDAFEKLKKSGKIKHWGVSNFDTDLMESLFDNQNGNLCATDQVLYNLSRRGPEFDLLPWCKKHNLPVMAYSPIEQSRLLSNEILARIAEKHNASASQIALGWILQNQHIIPIPKASTVEHVKDNFRSLEVQFTEEDNQMLDKVFPAPKRKVSLEMI
jgi:diketogulonate reductase-like aldo/keto reductase